MRRAPLLLLSLALAGCDDDGDAAAPPSPDAAVVNAELCAEWTPPACGGGEVVRQEDRGGQHVRAPEVIEYVEVPPASGPHRPDWARWGEYSALPPEIWLHNLEHGGAAFLHHPCADAGPLRDAVDAAKALDADLRYVLTPYPDLPSAYAVVTWEWVWSGPCVQADEVAEFLQAHYRRAPEDIAGDGRYAEGWLRR